MNLSRHHFDRMATIARIYLVSRVKGAPNEEILKELPEAIAKWVRDMDILDVDLILDAVGHRKLDLASFLMGLLSGMRSIGTLPTWIKEDRRRNSREDFAFHVPRPPHNPSKDPGSPSGKDGASSEATPPDARQRIGEADEVMISRFIRALSRTRHDALARRDGTQTWDALVASWPRALGDPPSAADALSIMRWSLTREFGGELGKVADIWEEIQKSKHSRG
jgi:hypothetical protein